jgi:hypothetical protein
VICNNAPARTVPEFCRFHKIKKTRATYAVLSLYWSPSFKIRSLRVIITTKTLGFSLSLTASRIDSIRTSQHFVSYKIVMLIINVNGHVTNQCPIQR